MMIKPIEELTFTDDYMFGRVMQNPEICKGLLERLLEIKIEKVEYPTLQKSISQYYETKGIRLDVYVKDSDKVFDIEIQNNPQIDLPKRTRYYQSMVDMDNLLKGQDYSDLKESFIIFICQFDPFNQNKPCYTFKNICLENNQLELNDKTTKIFFNSTAYTKEKDVEISSILEYIVTKVPSSNFTKQLNSLVEESKLNNKFRSDYFAMNLHDRDIKKQAYNDGLCEGIQKGISKGIYEKSIETAKSMLKDNLDIQTISKYTGLTVEVISSLKVE